MEKRDELQERIDRTLERLDDCEWRLSVHGPQFDSKKADGTCGNRAARLHHIRRKNELNALLDRLKAELLSIPVEDGGASVGVTTSVVTEHGEEAAADPVQEGSS